MKKSYTCLLEMERFKDAEILLRNIIEGIENDNSFQFTSDEYMQAYLDLLLHQINYLSKEYSPSSLLSTIKKILVKEQLKYSSQDLQSTIHMIIGIAYFISEKITYYEAKFHLKLALSMTEKDQIRAMILFNLAVLNYCEITDHNDRVINGEDDQLEEVVDQIQQLKENKLEEEKENKKMKLELEYQQRQKRFQERQQQLKLQARQQLSKLSKNFKFSKNRVQNNIQKQLAKKFENQILKQKLRQGKKYEQNSEEVNSRKLQSHILDLLKNSQLPKGVVINDIIKYGQEKKINTSTPLPRKTLECFYQQIIEGFQDFDKNLQFNEVMPLLFLSVKYEMQALSKNDEEYEGDDAVFINKLDDFLIYDQDYKLLTLDQYKLVEFITRVYISDSKRYQDQCQYWIGYLYKFLYQEPIEYRGKRIEALKAAYWIDDNKLQEAKELLEHLNKLDYTNEEKETELLVKSLLGMLKQQLQKTHEDEIEGLKLSERARELSDEVGLMYERIRWLNVAKTTQ